MNDQTKCATSQGYSHRCEAYHTWDVARWRGNVAIRLTCPAIGVIGSTYSLIRIDCRSR